MQLRRHPQVQFTTIGFCGFNAFRLTIIQIAFNALLKILAQLVKCLTFICDQFLAQTLNFSKQAVVILAVLNTTFIAFVFQIIHNTLPPSLPQGTVPMTIHPVLYS